MGMPVAAPVRGVANKEVFDIGGLGVNFRRPPVTTGIVGGKGMAIAETPVTWAHMRAAAYRLNGLDHGGVAMHLDGTVYITERGTKENPIARRLSPVARAGHVLITGEDGEATLRKGAIAELIPTSAQRMADPNFSHHPAYGSFYHFASLAALINDAQDDWFVRQPTDAEHDEIVLCGGALTEAQAKALAHLGAKGTVPVIGDDAERRRNPWGGIDWFGHMLKWLDEPFDLADLTTEKSINDIARVLRGAFYGLLPDDARVADRSVYLPRNDYDVNGAFLVAVPRAPQ